MECSDKKRRKISKGAKNKTNFIDKQTHGTNKMASKNTIRGNASAVMSEIFALKLYAHSQT